MEPNMYSTGFTAEAQLVHGEALQTRVYVRKTKPPYGISNYWDPSTGRDYLNNWLTTNIISLIGSPSPTGEDIYELSHINQGILNYEIPAGELQEFNSILLSTYIYSGSDFSAQETCIQVQSYVSGTSEDLWRIKLTESGGVVSIFNTSGTFIGNDITDEGDGWFRLSMAFEQPSDSNRGDRSYVFSLKTDFLLVGHPNLYYSSPQIEVGVTGASTYKYASGVYWHPSDLIELGGYNTILSTNPFVRKRERKYGVVQGTNQQISISNVDLTYVDNSLPDAWCTVQMGFPNTDEWETVLNGKINGVKTNTNLSCTLDVDDSIMDLLSNGIQRDMTFQNTPWVSEVTVGDKASDSSSYTGTVTFLDSLSGEVRDERYYIKFLDGTTYKIYNESDQPLMDNNEGFTETGTTFTYSVDNSFSPRQYTTSSSNVFTIPSSGWDGTTFSVGDTYEFTTSYARTTGQTTAIGMVKHLIEDISNITIYDVLNDEYYSTPLYEIDNWNSVMSGTGGYPALDGQIGGFWSKGSKLIEMIQDALKLEHCSIYPAENGQIALAYMANLQTGTTTINGDPNLGTVTIISGEVEDSNEDYSNQITVEYFDLETGEDKSTTNIEKFRHTTPKEVVINCKWGVEDSLARTCASRALFRFNSTKRTFTLDTTLAGIDVPMTDAIVIEEPFLGAFSEKVIVVEKTIDVNNQALKLIAWNDPLSFLNVAKVGVTTIDNAEELIW